MFWFLLNALIVLFFMWFVTKKYGTLLTPIGFFGGYYLLIATLAPMMFRSLGLLNGVPESAVTYTSILDSIFFIAIGTAFVVRSSPFKTILDRILRFILPYELKEEQSSGFAEFGLLCQAGVVYIGLMFLGSGGWLWITNTRLAYAMHRDSVGVLWSLCGVMLFLTFFRVLFRKAKSAKAVFGYTLCFVPLAWFLGSKGYMLIYFILALFYIDIRIKKVGTKTVVLIGTVVLVAGLGLQLFQGTAKDFLGTLTYFDYFSNTALLIGRFKDFGFHYGYMSLTTLWFYVPRGLYHAKPYVYGGIYADDFLYPGGPADGWTAGLMMWTISYCDFGVVGVILWGLCAGYIAKGAYELLLERQDVPSMMLFGQLGFIFSIELFANAPFLVFLAWLMVEIFFIYILSRIQMFPKLRRVRITKPSDSGAS